MLFPVTDFLGYMDGEGRCSCVERRLKSLLVFDKGAWIVEDEELSVFERRDSVMSE